MAIRAVIVLSAAFVLLMGAMFVAVASQSLQDYQGQGSFPTNAKLGLNAEQLRNATIALQVADDLDASPLARLAEMVAALGESDLKVVPNAGGSGYCGVFQAHPKNIACEDTKSQALHFLKGGLGFQAGGAIALAKGGGISPGTIATRVEASGQPGAFYDVKQPQAKKIIAAWQQGGRRALMSMDSAAVQGSPKYIIDTIVLPYARSTGMITGRTPEMVEAANARHGPTVSGGVSDHQGPPDVAWAADMSNGTSPTPEMDRLAALLAARFHIPWTGSGLVSFTTGGYQFQLIYRTNEGGDHYNHVHLGLHLISGPPTP